MFAVLARTQCRYEDQRMSVRLRRQRETFFEESVCSWRRLLSPSQTGCQTGLITFQFSSQTFLIYNCGSKGEPWGDVQFSQHCCFALRCRRKYLANPLTLRSAAQLKTPVMHCFPE